MKIKTIVVCLAVIFNHQSLADNFVDLYGDSGSRAEKVIKKYSSEIKKYASIWVKEIEKGKNYDFEDKNLPINLNRQKIAKKIKNEFAYLFVDLFTSYNPKNKNSYTTIGVIDQKHPQYLRFTQVPKEKISEHTKDLVADMISYNSLAQNIEIQKEINLDGLKCPAFYCAMGFQHKKLKPYWSKFNNGATQKKNLLIYTLKHSHDRQRRAGAAELIGFLKDPKEILSILIPYSLDQDKKVRYKVNTVISSTLMKSKIQDFNYQPFITLLGSPYPMDVSNALFVLTVASSKPKNQQNIINSTGWLLLNALRLKDTDTTFFAHRILSTVSGKDYAATDYGAWKKWLDLYNKENKKV